MAGVAGAGPDAEEGLEFAEYCVEGSRTPQAVIGMQWTR